MVEIGKPSSVLEVSREIPQNDLLAYFRSQFETESDLRDTLTDFILLEWREIDPLVEWLRICKMPTDTLVETFLLIASRRNSLVGNA